MDEYQWSMPKGWGRQQMQIPVDLGKIFRAAAGREASGGVKIWGTAAVALLLGLPEHAREKLIEEVIIRTRRAPNSVTPEIAWKVVSEAMAKLGETPEQTHYISRILDPQFLGEKKDEPPKRKRGAG